MRARPRGSRDSWPAPDRLALDRCADGESDYDLVWIVTDDELAARAERGEQRHVKQDALDIAYSSLERLAENAGMPGWFTSALLDAVTSVEVV